MKTTFYGVRGSIPTPGETTVKYGGNTTCIHIDTGERDYVLDSGTGIRQLGNELMKKHKGNVSVDVLLTHPHADHIQGFPFFAPAYSSKCTVEISRVTLDDKVSTASNKSEETNSLKEVYKKQQEPIYFPVSLEQMAADIRFTEFKGDIYKNNVAIKTLCHDAHPGGMVAYRIEKNGKSVAFTGDYEHDGKTNFDYGKTDKKVIEWAKNADILIMDAQYTPEEYDGKNTFPRKGWGHSTIERVCEIAAEAGVKKVVITHHDPTHDDKTLDAMQERSQTYMREVVKRDIPVVYAREGMTLEV